MISRLSSNDSLLLLGSKSVIVIAALALMGACMTRDNVDERPSVVASTTIVADLIQQVSGDHIQIQTIIPSGADPHTFTLTPGDIRAVASADLIVLVGMSLSSIETDLAEKAKGRVLILTDSMALKPFPPMSGPGHGDEHENDRLDPHFWMDLDLTIEAIATIRDTLSEVDEENAPDYVIRATSYQQKLQALDAEISETLRYLPAERKLLVTFHGAYGYFASRYGLTIVGFVAGDGEAEPSAAALADLIEVIEQTEVPYLFMEPQFNGQTLKQIAAATGTELRTLPSDTLSEEYPTYIDFLRKITDAIAR